MCCCCCCCYCGYYCCCSAPIWFVCISLPTPVISESVHQWGGTLVSASQKVCVEEGVCMCVVVVVVIVVIIVVVPPRFGLYVYLCPPRSYPNPYISGEILWFPPPKRCVCVHVCVCFYVPNNDDARRKIPTDAKAHTKEKMNRFFLKTPPLSIVQ